MRANWFANPQAFAVFTLFWVPTLAYAQEKFSVDHARETARLFFSAAEGFQPEDLLSRSEIEEFQNFLRKSKKYSSLTHPILLKRALPDEAPLVQMFNREGGSDVLRDAAEKLGGYAALEQTCLIDHGRRALLHAVEALSAEAAIQAAEQYAPRDSAKVDSRRVVRDRIYTLEDLLSEAFPGEG